MAPLKPDRPLRPVRLFPGQATPELPFFEEDWFRWYYEPPATCDKDEASKRARFFEVHELSCHQERCAFRPDSGCTFHPAGCECSFGTCQKEDKA